MASGHKDILIYICYQIVLKRELVMGLQEISDIKYKDISKSNAGQPDRKIPLQYDKNKQNY